MLLVSDIQYKSNSMTGVKISAFLHRVNRGRENGQFSLSNLWTKESCFPENFLRTSIET